jgi:predicted AAA+ superfamily ATPase
VTAGFTERGFERAARAGLVGPDCRPHGFRSAGPQSFNQPNHNLAIGRSQKVAIGPCPRRIYLRFAADRLTEALHDSPAVLIHGPPQSGKTTLAQRVAARAGYAYLSFDDEAIRSVATTDPAGFVADLPPRVILDEVEHVPQLFVTLKATIDRDRRPGRFVLTGSTNVLLLPKLSDSLAGRMAIVRLHPLAQCEIERTRPSFLERARVTLR